MEIDVIDKYFKRNDVLRPEVLVGIGDDAAIIKPLSAELAVTMDTLVEGTHFLPGANAEDIGYKALAVNLSDLAAMGATPAWVLMSLSLPEVKPDWLKAFMSGFFSLADKYQVMLVGGDLTKGPHVSITIQAAGYVKRALLRSNAQPGDKIYVSGTLGDAALGLKLLKKEIRLPPEDEKKVLAKLLRPQPKIALGQHLLKLAHAAIDISDGLGTDLGHLLRLSDVGAIVNVDAIPVSSALKHATADALQYALTGGDDYELCFTIAREKEKQLDREQFQLTCIGEITSTKEIIYQYSNGQAFHDTTRGYQHF